MRTRLKTAFAAVALAASATAAQAQTNDFNLGRNLDIQYTVLKSLAAAYVDTVDFDKILPVGLEAMLQSLDPYTTYIPETAEENFEIMTTGVYGGIGSLIRKEAGKGVVIFEPYAGSPAVKAGLEPGDEIIAIDGTSCFDETSEQATARMKGQPGTDVHFLVVKGRSRDTVEVTVRRERIHISDVKYSGIIRDSIGYISVTGFTENMSEELKQHVLFLKEKGITRLVLDLRGNGGGIMEEAVKTVSLFVPKGTLVVTSRGRNPMSEGAYYTREEPIDTLMPILVMTNSTSASSSEIVAGALQDLDRATIGGRRTFGKGLIQTVISTPYDSRVKFTTGKYYTPSGRCVQAIDYSHRNEDGSVGSVPDSLRKPFKTAGGRTVYDGGGITPDIEAVAPEYSRSVVSLIYNGIDGDYAIEYYKKNPQVAPPSQFRLTDAEYEDFVQYASKRDFDSRSATETMLDQMQKAAERDGFDKVYGSEIAALRDKVRMDKAAMLRLKKDEILPVIEQEIAVKYYYEAGGIEVTLRSDSQLDAAIDRWLAGEGVESWKKGQKDTDQK